MNGLYLITQHVKCCQIPFCFVLHGSYIFFLINLSALWAIEIASFLSHLMGIPKVAHWIISFVLKMFAITSATNLYRH